MPERIPAACVRPILTEFMNALDIVDASELARHLDAKKSTLGKILGGQSNYVGFDYCDELLCKMEAPHLWWEWPLIAFYLSADLRTAGEIDPEWQCSRGCSKDERVVRDGRIRCARCVRKADALRRSKVAA